MHWFHNKFVTTVIYRNIILFNPVNSWQFFIFILQSTAIHFAIEFVSLVTQTWDTQCFVLESERPLQINLCWYQVTVSVSCTQTFSYFFPQSNSHTITNFTTTTHMPPSIWFLYIQTWMLIDSGIELPVHRIYNAQKNVRNTLKTHLNGEKYHAGYLYWYGLGNVLGMKGCHIIW